MSDSSLEPRIDEIEAEFNDGTVRRYWRDEPDEPWRMELCRPDEDPDYWREGEIEVWERKEFRLWDEDVPESSTWTDNPKTQVTEGYDGA